MVALTFTNDKWQNASLLKLKLILLHVGFLVALEEVLHFNFIHRERAKCTPPEVEVSEGKCGIDQSRQGDGSADRAAATAADDDDGGDTNSGDGGDTNSGDGGEGQGEDD